jgi:hypothetical protein
VLSFAPYEREFHLHFFASVSDIDGTPFVLSLAFRTIGSFSWRGEAQRVKSLFLFSSFLQRFLEARAPLRQMGLIISLSVLFCELVKFISHYACINSYFHICLIHHEILINEKNTPLIH